jgi:hypothetical protein
MWKKIVALALGIFLVTTPVIADEFGLGGGYVTGHSEDKSYSVENDGYGGMLHFDKDMDWRKDFSENNAVGIDPGMAYFYLRWDKDVDKEETKTGELTDCRNCRKHTTITVEETINSHILAATMKPYWELYKKFRMFGVAGAGYEFADDENNAPVVLAGVGMQYMFTDSFGTSLGHYKIWSDPTNNYRRFDTTVLSLDFRF